jgi:3-hydroxyacyl-CoA dehydrogenase
MNVLSSSVLTELPECLDYLESNGFHALVIRQEQEHFCAGANLYEVISAIELGLLEKDPGLSSKAKKKAFEVMHPELPKLGKLYSIKKNCRHATGFIDAAEAWQDFNNCRS